MEGGANEVFERVLDPFRIDADPMSIGMMPLGSVGCGRVGCCTFLLYCPAD
jgi:hypothetical protein